MPSFRLFNLRKLAVEEFDLDNHPIYLAASHAWVEKVFGDQGDKFDISFGVQGLNAVIAQIFPNIEHCWVDKLCINQNDKQDKLRQIPLMGRIFAQAQAVVVLINRNIAADQSQIDTITQDLEGALAIAEGEVSQEDVQFWEDGDGRELIVSAMKGLQRLASTVWVSRVWTLQEYVVAQNVYWIGHDYKPVQVDERLMSTLPDVCDFLAIAEAYTGDMRIVASHLQGMASFRLRKMDPTRIMEMLINRQTKKSVDEVYGSMSASGVIIQPVAKESKYDAWRRWCETAVSQGHVRWVLLPVSLVLPDDSEQWNCAMPCFAGRADMSASSCLDSVEPLHTVSVSNGCITLWTKRLGTVELVKRLGSVHRDSAGRIHRDITIILFAKAKWKLATQVATAFGGGRYDSERIKALAQVMMLNYITAAACVFNHTEGDFYPLFRSVFQLSVWKDFMELQETQMLGLNEGIGYLCCIQSGYIMEQLVTVLVGRESVPETGLEAFNFEARTPENRLVLMIARANQSESSNDVLHKVAMTLPVSDYPEGTWQQPPPEIIKLGGANCGFCRTDRDETRSRSSQFGVASSTQIPVTTVDTMSVSRAFVRQLSNFLQHISGRARPRSVRHNKLRELRQRRTLSLIKLQRQKLRRTQQR